MDILVRFKTKQFHMCQFQQLTSLSLVFYIFLKECRQLKLLVSELGRLKIKNNIFKYVYFSL